MSQDFNTTSKKPGRITRAQRNRPVLVTPDASEQEVLPAEETSTPDTGPMTLVDTPPTPKRRIAGFFSTVGKSDSATEIKESDIAKARLARATHGKATTGKPDIKEETPEAEKKPAASKTGTSARPGQQKPPSLFKPRYIFGMIVYLIAADFLGTFERNILTSMGVEHLITKFSLFGFPITVTPSGLTYIATLIIILIILVRMDFLPTSLNAMAGNQPARRGTTARNTTSRDTGGDGPRPQPPAIRQGVQGADDDLYRAYRTNQRREKKR
ncbi:MAG: hypothetical protein JO215_03455 [Ktedonobacteraceae bacterium]|nr:hypothetical protein [Ktedonobacteraceae bacterium]